MSLITLHYDVPGDDFTRAGEASGNVKTHLKKLGFDPAVVRNVVIALYEAEINMVIHANGGEIDAEIEDIEEVVEDLEDAVEGHDEELEELEELTELNHHEDQDAPKEEKP